MLQLCSFKVTTEWVTVFCFVTLHVNVMGGVKVSRLPHGVATCTSGGVRRSPTGSDGASDAGAHSLSTGWTATGLGVVALWLRVRDVVRLSLPLFRPLY